MIENDQQLKNTRRKLARLEDRAAVLEHRLRNEPISDATRVTLYSYRGLIRQLPEEISRYELGINPPPRSRLENQVQLRAAIGKLESLQWLEEKHAREPATRARKISLLSLRRMINQLQEEIAWYEAGFRQHIESTSE